MDDIFRWTQIASTVALVMIGLSQAFIIPFVRGVKEDVKTATESMHQMQITLARMEVTERNDVELRRAAEQRTGQIHDRVHTLANKLNALILNLALAGVYKPSANEELRKEEATKLGG